jgi:hypothetical protein
MSERTAPAKGDFTTTAYIIKYAGKYSAAEMAAALKVTIGAVRAMACKQGVSLSVRHLKVEKPGSKKAAAAKPERGEADQRPVVLRDTLERRIDAASRLLREQGWTVLRPDPFLQMQIRRSA